MLPQTNDLMELALALFLSVVLVVFRRVAYRL
ncbi:hypothetical protein AFE_1337 [Acidithiobacillus ferrooxidans ATCC 23270]|uniref:Uncharacterized protein n=1 Tax=Acidithiobacillus ferrooxidans (strain ATCC 23270 / DSM 14882 / CIP 104768 / NCIMB 8455) TaxID=243159 RepID=B7J9E2_ACIF2|nr:hypothetical protein AFE_1337 [Acidithiobacillus ferrooxidans ATCC 23270]